MIGVCRETGVWKVAEAPQVRIETMGRVVN